MTIKRLQLRGISRTPSDRMTAAGGCAESLNVQLQDQELAPAVAPKMLPVLPQGYTGKVLFIHKVPEGENYIGQDGSKLVWIKDTPEVILEGLQDEAHLNSNGNLLIVVAGERTSYLLLKDGRYRAMSDSVPFPELQFAADVVTPNYELSIDRGYDGGLLSEMQEGALPFDMYDVMPDSGYALAEDTGAAELSRFTDLVWNRESKIVMSTDKYNRTYDEVRFISDLLRSTQDEIAKDLGMYYRPVFARYSLVLFDGSEIVSSPFLLAPTMDANSGMGWSFQGISLEKKSNSSKRAMRLLMTANVNRMFRISLSSDTIEAVHTIRELQEDWADIVSAVRVYLSLDVMQKELESYTRLRLDAEPTQTEDVTINLVHCTQYTRNGEISIYEPGIDPEQFLAAATFFCVDEFKLSELDGGRVLPIEYLDNTQRALKDTLSNVTVQPLHAYRPLSMISFNGRIISSKTVRTNYRGAVGPMGISMSMENGFGVSGDNYLPCRIYYRINDKLGGSVFTPGVEARLYASTVSYLSYPDENCSEALLHLENQGWYRIQMTQHPSMPASYFAGLEDSSFLQALYKAKNAGGVAGGVAGVFYLGLSYELPESTDEIVYKDKIFISSLYNPFIYEGSQDLNAEIYGLSVNTQALSAGQHGEAPILAFTAEGIYGIFLDDEGHILKADPLPRDIAIRDRIWQIDNATVFLTDKGLHLISGSQVAPLSDGMLGKPYHVDVSVLRTLRFVKQNQLAGIVADNEITFVSFMKSASMAYDYNGKRLLFFNPEKDYAYVLSLQTQTWHKIALPEGFQFSKTLNSYPEAQVVLSRRVLELWADEYDGPLDLDDEYDCRQLVTALLAEAVHEGIQLPSFSTEQWEMFVRQRLGISHDLWSSQDLDHFKELLERYEFVVVDEPAMAPVVYDYSTVLTDADLYKDSASETVCVVVTRPFDLDAPDMLKSITDLRIRGDFERYDVEGHAHVGYFLMGSQDGIHFFRLLSLRGKSWKLFRLVILAHLRPYERISYVDIDFTVRFDNKLR